MNTLEALTAINALSIDNSLEHIEKTLQECIRAIIELYDEVNGIIPAMEELSNWIALVTPDSLQKSSVFEDAVSHYIYTISKELENA